MRNPAQLDKEGGGEPSLCILLSRRRREKGNPKGGLCYIFKRPKYYKYSVPVFCTTNNMIFAFIDRV